MLDRATRGRDLQLSSLQSALTKVGHITAQTTNTLLAVRAESSELDIDTLVRMNADVIALLGHISFELSQRRRDAIRPHLHREFRTLCASHVPITSFLFGDELQTQINHIRTSNKIGNTATSSNTPWQQQSKHSNPRHKPWRPFLARHHGNMPYRKANQYPTKNFKKTSDHIPDRK
ncbi:Hypothetical predicted protein [Paramuricea clavata]|uniref:Uncharacterized protein n=1 Tax=Paramuricea clavata TaxID=317549 RepID=A0A6S7L061_PARCT|nr:Hypothetical predicted protein [Paramuricea clavata]